MRAPTDEDRRKIADGTVGLRDIPNDEEAEAMLDDALSYLVTLLEKELDTNPPEDDDAEELAAACVAWASVASYALASAYAPASPFPRNLAGFGQRALKRILKLVKVLRRPLSVAQKGLGASSYSIGISFPWGISISFQWP